MRERMNTQGIMSKTFQGGILVKYDFTTVVDRSNTGAHKWNAMKTSNPEVEEGVLPLSVADMELKSAPEIYEGLIDYLKEEPILGYTGATDAFLEAVVKWQEKRHQWIIEKDWIVNTPGVVAAMDVAIRAFSEPGDGVIIFRPVYFPFTQTVEANNREVVNVPLNEEDGYYTIDFEAFEKAAAQSENKILLFCNPHNPVGRVWTEEELAKIAKIAVEHDLYVVSDEIWNDLIHPDHNHRVLHQINFDLQKQLITCTSASKTFNLAGISASNIIISNKDLRERFVKEANESHLGAINVFGYKATELAYTKGEEWLEELLELISSNQEMVKTFFETNYPKVKAPVSEGTYVQWLDFREVDFKDHKEREAFLNEAQFFINPGYIFGEEGRGFERINVALPQKELEKLLNRLLEALKEREQKG